MDYKIIKNKLWIKSRVFLSFFLFIITLVNIFAFLLYYLVSKNIKTNIDKSIISEFQTIRTFIDLQSSNIFSLPKYEVEKINNLWFYFYIWNNDLELQKKYSLGYYRWEENIIFRWDYKWYNVVIWKELKDFNDFKNSYFEILMILNILLLFWLVFILFFLTKFSIKPLLDLSDFLDNYNFNSNNFLLKNRYWESELGKLTKSINNFIKNNNKILETQNDFIQDISHELKTPLMQIDSNIELIEDKIIDKNIKTKVFDIKNSVKNINEITSNLSFILWGERERKKEEINMEFYFQSFIKKYSSLAGSKNINISILKKYDLILNSNVYYLDRLFWNLILNAIFYNKWDNIIQIIINKKSIVISDNGIWIKQEEIDKIFSRFYRNMNSGLYYKNGNWLWLVIVKKICDILWWKIKIESNLWKGTDFIILL